MLNIFKSQYIVFINRISKGNFRFFNTIILVVLVRVIIYIWLYYRGYFYGIPWDTFSRTAFSFHWAQSPYFFTYGDAAWLPLQFWIVGILFFIFNPARIGQNIIIPVIVNNIFFIGSLSLTWKLTDRLFGKNSAILACFFASIFAGDIFVSYSGLCEPILIFFIIWAAFYTQLFLTSAQKERHIIALKLAFVTLAATYTHYIGWSLVLVAVILFSREILKNIINRLPNQKRMNPYYLLAILISIIGPIVWLVRCYYVFGDFLYPLRHISELSAGFPQYSIYQKISLFLKILINVYGILITFGILAFIYLIRKRYWTSLYYLLVPITTLVIYGLDMITSASPPYPDPRYYIFLIWATFPITSYAIWSLWVVPKMYVKATAILISLVLLGNNIFHIAHFKNSFSIDVREVSEFSGHLLADSDYRRVIIETDSYAEEFVIPVAARYSWKFDHVSLNDIFQHINDLESYFEFFASDWIGISKNKDVANEALLQGLCVYQVGHYYLLSAHQENWCLFSQCGGFGN
jgi:hypothetical protein